MNESRKVLTIDEFGEQYRIGRTKVFEEIRHGRLRTYTVGRRRYTTPDYARDWQEQRVAEADAAVTTTTP